MTQKARKLTTLASAAVLAASFAGSAMAQSVNASVGVTANVGVTGASGATSGVSGLLSGVLGDVTGLLGGLGLGGIL